jgi:hypothetical protein
MIADVVVNKVHVQAGTIRADGVFTILPKLLFFHRLRIVVYNNFIDNAKGAC